MSGLSTWVNGSSLRQRTWTALILGPLVIAAVWWLPTPGFALFLALVILAGAWEWARLVGMGAGGPRAGYLAAVAGGLGVLWLVPGVWGALALIAALWWMVQAGALLRVRAVAPRTGPDAGGALAGLLVLCAPWAAMVGLHARGAAGPALVLFLFMLIWMADSAAFFVGRRWGRARLAPLVSPGKTWAGAYGALTGGALAGLVLAYGLGLDTVGAWLAAVVCALTVAFSIVGDLFESLAKRRRGVKDSSRLLPGHGGVLDRIDSLTAAAPVFALGISLIGLVNP